MRQRGGRLNVNAWNSTMCTSCTAALATDESSFTVSTCPMAFLDRSSSTIILLYFHLIIYTTQHVSHLPHHSHNPSRSNHTTPPITSPTAPTTTTPHTSPHTHPLTPLSLSSTTVCMTSYSTLTLTHFPTLTTHFRSLLPPNIPILLALHCLHGRAPSREICQRYTGVSEPVQRVVRGSGRAMREIEEATQRMLECLRRGNAVASILTICCAGTHRGVAAAEIFGEKLRGWGRGC